ncbi:MAG TPA: cobalt-precorrin-5B (C(1))-methyltransferase CbiD [Methanothermobacter sp.]|nr:putative cobalt-precorrin-6A synthase [deacetylating] [Methanothermobacter sp. MT-2]HHW05259.1 cobalamin biosynthesis protein CbiD [Methanothermobacter sp.]HOK72871.1 cobalt-precorrin-5B (C(1))-methyltransferase CbiD [Methanothermobacter sp.]HOL69044.1 cobalt-precorrin-5B (C(1))-methyltransferase CbiD [Methanothermobacter sp.]HPQ04820.1 cobalt-precorrin-5B (C(1))-methyltransferase CbiD [Methanothermobacter sp.]
MNEKNQDFGITTGAAATAAAVASILHLNGEENIKNVFIDAPYGKLKIDIKSVEKLSKEKARAIVVKRPYNDPDVTVNIDIIATVKLNNLEKIIIKGGEGVGKVTKPGLPTPPGKPAINPTPKKMIKENIKKHLPPGKGATVTISVPEGKKIAKKTMNPKLGIKGGISILGTTGIARPMSSKAYKDSLACQIDIAASQGWEELVFVPGNIGEKIAKKHFKNIQEDRIIQMGNFPGYMLKIAAKKQFKKIILLGHAGKLIKIGAGIFNTKNSIADGRREIITAHAALNGASKPLLIEIFKKRTVEEMITELDNEGLTQPVFNSIASSIKKKCQERYPMDFDVLIFDLKGRKLNTNSKTRQNHTFQ